MFDKQKHLDQFLQGKPSFLVNIDSYFMLKAGAPTTWPSTWGYPAGMKSQLDPSNVYPSSSNYWADPQNVIFPKLFELHDSNLAEHLLGFDEGSMDGQSYYWFSDLDPKAHNYRIATGLEPGANLHFTGLNSKNKLDSSLYYGRTSGFVKEAISDGFSFDEKIEFHKIVQQFTNPLEESRKLIRSANTLQSMPKEDREKASEAYKTASEKLEARTQKIRDYVYERAETIKKEIRTGLYKDDRKLREDAAKEVRWCEKYVTELSTALQYLKFTRKELNVTRVSLTEKLHTFKAKVDSDKNKANNLQLTPKTQRKEVTL